MGKEARTGTLGKAVRWGSLSVGTGLRLGAGVATLVAGAPSCRLATGSGMGYEEGPPRVESGQLGMGRGASSEWERWTPLGARGPVNTAWGVYTGHWPGSGWLSAFSVLVSAQELTMRSPVCWEDGKRGQAQY